MREIKFRGKHKFSSVWVFGYYVEDDKGHKWRPLSLEDDFIFENYELALQRQQARERNRRTK